MGFFDKLFGGDRGKKREERDREFIAANTAWGSATAAPRTAAPKVARKIDREGLQAAFLDQSGRIAYFLDSETGDVLDDRDGGVLMPPRYRRVPARPSGADAADRQAFVNALEPSPLRDRLAASRDAVSFRGMLAEDRNVERAWYVFRNDRATAEVEKWLEQIGLA